MRKLLKSKKALSPVVAAIILIAVTVAVSIAVAAWMGSLTFTFMETEELKITSVDFTTTTATVHVRNTGTTDVVLISGTVNNVDGSSAWTGDITCTKGTATTSAPIVLSGNFTAGTNYNIELLSSKGNKFQYTETA
jgi:flagellin-like protein